MKIPTWALCRMRPMPGEGGGGDDAPGGGGGTTIPPNTRQLYPRLPRARTHPDEPHPWYQGERGRQAPLPPSVPPTILPTGGIDTRDAADQQLTVTAVNEVVQVTYGQQKIGADVVYWDLDNENGILYVVFFLGEGPIDGVVGSFDDRKITIDGRTPGQLQLHEGHVPPDLDGDGKPIGDYFIHLGESDQEVDAVLLASNPNYIYRHPGRAYIVFRFPEPRDDAIGVYNALDFTCEIRGRLVRDVRNNLVDRVYSTNPVLHTFDLLTSHRYGAGMPDDTLDSGTDGSWATAATDCDFGYPTAPADAPALTISPPTGTSHTSPGIHSFSYTYVVGGLESNESPAVQGTFEAGEEASINLVPGPAGTTARKVYMSRSVGDQRIRYLAATVNNNVDTESPHMSPPDSELTQQAVNNFPGVRYEMGLMLRDAKPVTDWLEVIRAHFMGFLASNSGLTQIFVDKARDPVVGFTFTDSGTSANISGRVTIRQKGRAAVPTRVVAHYIDRQNGYQDATAQTELSTVSGREEELIKLDLQLPGCFSYDQAQRITIQYQNRAIRDKELEFDALIEGLRILPGDVVPIQIYAGEAIPLLDTNIVITDAQPDNDGMLWRFKAEFYDRDDYSDHLEENVQPISPQLGSPFDVPPDPTDVVVVERVVPNIDGNLTVKLEVTWTPARTIFLRGTFITDDDGAVLRTIGEFEGGGPIYIENPRRAFPNTITLYSVTIVGVMSPGVSVTITPVIDPNPPPNVDNLTAPYLYAPDRGNVWWTIPQTYQYIGHFEVYDTFDPTRPVLAATVPLGSSPTEVEPLRLDHYIHGDGYASDQYFAITVYTVSRLIDPVTNLPERSSGVSAQWMVPASGEAIYDVGADPRDITYDDENIWVSNFGSGTLTKLRRSDGALIGEYPVGTKPYGLTYDGNDIWVCNFGDDTVYRVDKLTGDVLNSVDVSSDGTGPFGIIFANIGFVGKPALWVSAFSSDNVLIIDPFVYHVLNAIPVGGSPALLHEFNGVVYVAVTTLNAIVGIIPSMGQVTTFSIDVGNQPIGITNDGNYLWVANYGDSTLSKVDVATRREIQRVPLEPSVGPVDVAFDGTYIWASEGTGRFLSRIDIAVGRVTAKVPLGSYARTVIFDGKDLWVPNNVNGASATEAITVFNPGFGGGLSNIKRFTVNGVDVSPFPA